MFTDRLTLRAWLLILPLVVVMLAVIGWPLADTVRLSFTDARLVGTGGASVGSENYADMLSSRNFRKALPTVVNATLWRLIYNPEYGSLIVALGVLAPLARAAGRHPGGLGGVA